MLKPNWFAVCRPAVDLVDEKGVQHLQIGENRCKQMKSCEAGICGYFQGL